MGESEVVRRTGGQLNSVYEVRPPGGAPVIVKRYADEWRWKQAKEVHVYRLLAEHGVGPVPEVVHVDAERAVTVLTRPTGGSARCRRRCTASRSPRSAT